LFDQVVYFTRFREAFQGTLGKHQLTVNGDLEDAAAGSNHLGLSAKIILDLSRQTGGAGFVVSNLAIFN